MRVVAGREYAFTSASAKSDRSAIFQVQGQRGNLRGDISVTQAFAIYDTINKYAGLWQKSHRVAPQIAVAFADAAGQNALT